MNAVADLPASAPASAVDDTFVMPASVGQKRFWLLEEMSPGNTALNVPIAFELLGPLDIGLLERALQAIVDRHESLRTRLELIDGEPHQIISSHARLTLEKVVETSPAVGREERIQQAMNVEAQRPVDFHRAPLLRAVLLALAPEDHVLMVTQHHIICDGWSNGIVIRELAAFYDAFRLDEEPKLPPLAIQYADYVLWQKEWLETPEFRQQLDYWRAQLGGEIPVLDFPTDFPRQATQPSGAVLETRLLPTALAEALRRVCQEEGVTLFMIFVSAYAALLHRYTGQSRILVGTTAANRNRPELEAIIGLFANLLVVPADITGSMTLRELLARQRDQSLGGFANHEAPFELIVQELQSAGSARVPMHTHLLFQRAFMQPAVSGELTINPLRSVSPGSTFELTFGIVERLSEGIRLQMEYRTSLYRRDTIRLLLLHFEQLLEALAAHPETPLDELPLFADNEREEIEARLETALRGSGQIDRAAVFAELERQIDAQLQRGQETFTPAQIPPGLALAALDSQRRPLPIDMLGDIYLAAPGDASPQVTPFFGRNVEGGGVELWGRASELVRVQGFRCNRRALEVALRSWPEVADAASANQTTPSGASRLVAQVVLKPGATITEEELRGGLKGKMSDLLASATIQIVSQLRRDVDGQLLIEAETSVASPVSKTETSSDVPLQALLQQQLMELWQRLLKTDSLTLDSNFFENGGNSFLALRMMIEAGQLAGQQLPLSLLLSGATIRNLARHILEGANVGGQAVIPVQPNGSRTPLFFLHGDWIGGGFYCHRLAHNLGPDQPFYALPPYHMREEKITTMQEMAAYHCAAIRKERPHGPYLVGGYCIGALVAVEVARQLSADGETVEQLFLVDPSLWGGVGLRGLWPWIDRLGDGRGWNMEKKIAFFDRTAVAMNRWLNKPPAAKMATVLRRFGVNSAEPTGGSAPSVEDDLGGSEILDGLDFSTYVITYRLHRFAPLTVPTTFLFPESTEPHRVAEAAARSRLDLARVKVETIPGNHTTCITQHTAELAQTMMQAVGRG